MRKRKVLFILLQAITLLCSNAWAAKSDVVTSNTAGATVSFSSSGTYEWEWYSSGSKLRSTNYHIDSSTSQTTMTINTSSSCKFSFDYGVSSESGYDKLTITLDGSTIVNAISGNVSNTYSSTLSSGSHSLVLKYVKDSSQSTGDDRAYVSNMKLGASEAPFTSKQFVIDGVKYETLVNGTVKVIANSYSGEVNIPSSVKYENATYPISSITSGVLDNCSSVSLPVYYDFGNNTILKRLYIGEGITSFRGFSSCTALEDVSLPGSLTSIESTFTNCKSIKTLAFRYGSSKLKGMTQTIFEQMPLDSVFIDREFDFTYSKYSSDPSPFSLYKESYYSQYIHTLRVVRIGDNLTTVPARMFYNCNELRKIILGNSLITIENYGFGDCEKVEGEIVMPSTLKTIGDHAFDYGWCLAEEGKIVLNEGLETIGESAFYWCPKLSIECIPSTVTSIGKSAFSRCEFERLSIPNKVTSIGGYAFGTITESLIIEDGTSTLTLSEGAFNNSGSKYKSLYLGRNIVHKESSSSPFDNPYSNNLKDVIIGDYVTSIPANTFCRCSVMESITIGSKVSSIGKDAFAITGLSAVTIKAVTAPTITAPSFTSGVGVFSGIPVYVPAGCKASYLAANYWKNNIIIDPSDELITVNLTMPGTLEGRLRIQHVNLTDIYKLKITGEMNDDDWAYIKKTNIPNMYYLDLSEITNTSIPAQQFQSHTYLVNAVLPNGITTIGDYAFEGSNLSGDFTMPSSLEQIGNYAFKGTKIGDISLSSNVTVGNYAFNNSKLKSITLNKCTSIGQYAFAGCSNLSGSYHLYSGLTSIPDYAFQNCSSLEGIELPKALKTIGNGAFQNCNKLTYLEFYSGITSFGSSQSSFSGCSGITSIKAHWQRPISIMATTFENVNKTICELYVPRNSADWYLLTNGWQEFINVIEYDDTEKETAEFNFIDGEDYSNSETKNVDALTFTKTFSASAVGNWNAFYVPMSIDVEEYAGELDFAEIYAFSSTVDTNGDGVVDANDEKFLFVNPVKQGCTKPNVPYLIRPHDAKTYVINSADNILYKAAIGEVSFSTAREAYTIVGLYAPYTVMAGDNNYFISSPGILSALATGEETVLPNRWIMRYEEKEYGSETAAPSPANIKEYMILTIGEDIDNETALELINDNSANRFEEGYIYTLDGMKVKDTQHMRSGIYLQNGKKVLVR